MKASAHGKKMQRRPWAAAGIALTVLNKAS